MTINKSEYKLMDKKYVQSNSVLQHNNQRRPSKMFCLTQGYNSNSSWLASYRNQQRGSDVNNGLAIGPHYWKVCVKRIGHQSKKQNSFIFLLISFQADLADTTEIGVLGEKYLFLRQQKHLSSHCSRYILITQKTLRDCQWCEFLCGSVCWTKEDGNCPFGKVIFFNLVWCIKPNRLLRL